MPLRWLSLAVVALAATAVGPALADEENQRYEMNERVELYVNKVGPFRNPQETYLYFSLPYCVPERAQLGELESHLEGLGEALQGYELRQSGLDIKFRQDVPETVACTSPPLTEAQRSQFQHAIMEQYWYQLFLDDLPIWGMVGEVVPNGQTDELYLYTHKKFVIAYNGDQVIEVNLTSEAPVSLSDTRPIDFSYSVEWVPTTTPFEDRFKKYLDFSFFEHQIHWFSIFNSFMMVIFLVGLVSLIMVRTLRKDFARYGAYRDDDLEDGEIDLGDESGWKQVHGDVFRAPTRLALFCSLVGVGHQLAVLALITILLSIVGNFYEDRGMLLTIALLLYAFTSGVGGYSSGGLYARNGGKQWIRTLFLTALVFPVVVSAVAFVVNFVAIGYGSLAAIPFLTMLVLFLLWALVSVPLTLIGTVLGRNFAGQPSFPCRIAPHPKEIPEKPWFTERWVHVALGGVLPFGSIFIEMYFVLTSFWHYKVYYAFGFALLVFLILSTVVVCVCIVSTYLLLSAEDPRWHWTSAAVGGSVGVYAYIYSLYYFVAKTHMSGLLQTSMYFSTMFIVSVALALMCAGIGYAGASLFVHKLYAGVKIE